PLNKNTGPPAPPPPRAARGGAPPAAPRKSNPGSPWTDQETAHLIDAYEERWNSLKRGQLKAQQWEEVAAEVAARCGFTVPSKTGTQCRHKIEKLRKRYRSERLRPVRSSWTFFGRIDRMERGSAPISALPASSDEDEDSAEPRGSNTRSINGILREAAPWEDSRGSRSLGKRKRLPADEEEDDDDENDVEDGGDVGEMAAELRRFGEGYVRMERRRMDVMRELEREWMEMEVKRMEMIMEAQRGLMETIAGAFSKKAKNSSDM
ncbi:trihelix transcription factor ASIL1-like, partial [Phalaenopsis equestris]|uniref:trihelix transcription factor ASIL1-like n=1 Tax=Phalaenopsis equestris TaxID=78828 RepID=UPI0009E3AE15